MQAVFGYGSLCDLQTLRTNEKIKRPLKKTCQIGILPKYKIRLNKLSYNGKHSYCNVEYTGNEKDQVYGIILYLTSKELKSVNHREGFIGTHSNSNAYDRFKLNILTPKGIEQAYVYIANKNKTSPVDIPTSKTYATHIINGLHFLMCRDKQFKFFKDKNYFLSHEKYYLKMST